MVELGVDAAVATLEAALAIRRELGQPALIASTDEALAAARIALGRPPAG